MKKRIWIVVLIIIVLFISQKVYTDYSDKKLMDSTNAQLKHLFEPFINNTVVVMNEDKYHLQIKHAELSDNVEPYKERLDYGAYITFDIYKNKVNKESFVARKGIRMKVWRHDLDSEFFTNAIGDTIETSYKEAIFSELASIAYESLYKDLGRFSEDELFVSSYPSGRGYGRFDEDQIEVNQFGEITKPGEVNYSLTKYTEGLSAKFTTNFYIEDFKHYNEMYIKVEKTGGDYHPLWDLKADNINEVEFYFEGEYENKKIVQDSDTIQELVDYLKALPFVKFDEQVQDVEEYFHINLENYEHHITMSTNEVYTNYNHALCFGEDYVNKILQILGEESQ